MPKIYFLDVTNRDGVQTARIGLSKLRKTILNLKLAEFGTYQSECGFPFTKQEQNYINANLELQKLGALGDMKLSGWSRALKEDVIKSHENCPELKDFNLSISTSVIMTEGKFAGKIFRRPQDKHCDKNLISIMQKAVKTARELGAETIGVNSEDGSRTDMEYLLEFAIAAKEAGADRLRYCDTLGYDDPFTIRERCQILAETVKIPIEPHIHNDLGIAVATSVAGAIGSVDGGQDAYINVTCNGYGERAGNADYLSCILTLTYASGFKEKYPNILGNHIDLRKSANLFKYAAFAFGLPIPIDQVGIGANAFAHESGIHADGALKNRKNYELISYEELGMDELQDFEIVHPGRIITVGEYSGLSGLKHVYSEIGIEFKNDKEARRILALCQEASSQVRHHITHTELKFIAEYPDIAAKILTRDWL